MQCRRHVARELTIGRHEDAILPPVTTTVVLKSAAARVWSVEVWCGESGSCILRVVVCFVVVRASRYLGSSRVACSVTDSTRVRE